MSGEILSNLFVLSQTVHIFQFACKMVIFSIMSFFLLLFSYVLSWTGQYTTTTTIIERKNEEKKKAKREEKKEAKYAAC